VAVPAVEGAAEVQQQGLAFGFQEDLVAADFGPAAEDADGEISATNVLHQKEGLPRPLQKKMRVSELFCKQCWRHGNIRVMRSGEAACRD